MSALAEFHEMIPHLPEQAQIEQTQITDLLDGGSSIGQELDHEQGRAFADWIVAGEQNLKSKEEFVAAALEKIKKLKGEN